MRIVSRLVILVLLAVVVYQFEFNSTPAPSSACQKVSVTERAAQATAWVGSVFHKAEGPGWQQPEVAERVNGGFKWLSIMGQSFEAGKLEGRDAAYQTVAALVPPRIDCTPDALDPCLQGLGGNATLQNSVRTLSGAALAADALRRAGFPAAEIPTFVAIAYYETKPHWNPESWNDTGAGMAGMWQLNQQYWHLENWRDPYANAVMAKKVRDESVANGNSPWYPWSTWRTAVANASKYASLSNTPTPNTTPPVTGSITTPDCDTTGAGGPMTAGQWNTAAKNPQLRNPASRINANAGFADIVCLNEVKHNSALKVPGYSVAPGKMAVPLIWKTAKLDRLELHRTTVLTGYAKDKSAVHGVWRNRATGKSFAALCTHMLVQGGSGWRKQAAAVNRLRDGYRKRGLPVMVLADMNAPQPKVLDFFAGKPTGGRIDFMVTYGMPQPKMSKLSNGGSDHARRLFTFPPDPGTGSATVGGGVAPSRFDQQGNPRTVEQAIAWLKAHPNGAPGEQVQGRCERYQNLAFGLGSGYASAGVHWRSSGPTFQGDPPRGALVFWDTSGDDDHVALSVGGGRVISTDFDGTSFHAGVISEGPLTAIDKWGPRLGWRNPNFNVGSGQ